MTSKVFDLDRIRAAIELIRIEMLPPDALSSSCTVRVESVTVSGTSQIVGEHSALWPCFVFSPMNNPNSLIGNARIAEALEAILFAARENMLEVVPVAEASPPPNSIPICTPSVRHCLSSKPCAIHEIPHRGETHELTPTKNNGTASPEARIKLLEARIEKLEGGSPRRARSDLLAW